MSSVNKTQHSLHTLQDKTLRFACPKHDIHDPMDTNAHHHLETNNARQYEPVDRKKKHRPIIPQHTAVNAQHRAMPLLESLTPTEQHLDVSLANTPRKDPTSKHTHRVPLTNGNESGGIKKRRTQVPRFCRTASECLASKVSDASFRVWN